MYLNKLEQIVKQTFTDFIGAFWKIVFIDLYLPALWQVSVEKEILISVKRCQNKGFNNKNNKLDSRG